MMQESILRFFQSIATPFLDEFFTYVTMLGEQYFIILIVAWIYWNYSKKDGLIMMVLFLISTLFNLLLKDIFQTKRPFQKLQNFEGKRVETAIGFSFPSGHTQGATTLFVNLALIFKRTKYIIFAILTSLLVAVSRVYLGVHWPIDVLGGFFAALIVVFIFYPYLDKLYQDQKKFIKTLLIILAIFYLVLLTVAGLNQFILSDPLDIKSYLSLVGITSGCIIGFIFEERKFTFTNNAKIWIKILRYLIGLIISIALLVGLKLILPDNGIFNWFRYFLVGAWITGIYPIIGAKIKLFNKEKLTVNS